MANADLLNLVWKLQTIFANAMPSGIVDQSVAAVDLIPIVAAVVVAGKVAESPVVDCTSFLGLAVAEGIAIVAALGGPAALP